MKKKIMLLFALFLLAAALPASARAAMDLDGASEIFIPRYINDYEPIKATVAVDGDRIQVNFSGETLGDYLWDIDYDEKAVALEDRQDNRQLTYRIVNDVESTIALRLVVPGRLCCPKYTLVIAIPAMEGEDIQYTEYVPNYTQPKTGDRLAKAFFRELFGG